jgi:CRISPR-associated protein Csm1
MYSPDEIACQIMQEAVSLLAHWAGTAFPTNETHSDSSNLIAVAKNITNWRNQPLSPLQLVFDQICLSSKQPHSAPNYRPAWALEHQLPEQYPGIPYAQSAPPSAVALDALRSKIRAAIAGLDRQNLVQLTMFVEKFGSHLSITAPDLALIDLARSTAAIASALAQQPSNDQLALIGGDLMGVQKFIYTISSDGALKSLRARSFYLELATEEIVQQILTTLNLPRTNIIYAGASKFYLLAAATPDLSETLERIQNQFNDWLSDKFQRKVFLAIAQTSFPAEQLRVTTEKMPPLAKIWQQVNQLLTAQASRKFVNQLDTLLEPRTSHTPCKVCHRDDVQEEKLKLLNPLEPDSPLVCEMCASMFRLGNHLPKVQAWVRSPRSYNPEEEIQVQQYYYRPATDKPKPGELVFQINNWDLAAYANGQTVPMLLGNYFQNIEETGKFQSASEIIEAAQGIQRIGYLRMDVDRLSQIFSKGLGSNYTLPRLACLSRQMTYFFKVYLNSLADARQSNFIDQCDTLDFKRIQHPVISNVEPRHDKNLRKNLLFIYAGGDDLFVSGAWDETVEFAFDVYQAFRAYTGHNPDITLSAGIYLAGAKFPLYQAAEAAGEIESAAKSNGRDSFGLFDAALKWDEWLGNYNLDGLEERDRTYLTTVAKPAMFGVLPFVKKLYQTQGYTSGFVRNLLSTAQVQEEKLKEAKQNNSDQTKDIRYFLHLPKIAYTLARLPSRIRDDTDLQDCWTSLKSPRNANYFRAIATWLEFLNR